MAGGRIGVLVNQQGNHKSLKQRDVKCVFVCAPVMCSCWVDQPFYRLSDPPTSLSLSYLSLLQLPLMKINYYNQSYRVTRLRKSRQKH